MHALSAAFFVCLVSSAIAQTQKPLSEDGNIQSQLGEIFSAGEYRFTGGMYQEELFRYRIFIPETASDDSELPMLVWLHGHGESGRDNLIHLRWFDRILQRLDDLSEYRFYILAVQYPPENPRWFFDHGKPDPSLAKSGEMCELVKEILDQERNDRRIDDDRIYLAGVSNGAAGCWEFAMRYPDLFAAVVPMGSPDIDSTRLNKLIHTPFWVFNNSADPISPLPPIQHAVDELKSIGGQVKLTICEGSDHDCWTAAFSKHQAMDWMLAQRKGQVPVDPWPDPEKSFELNLIKN